MKITILGGAGGIGQALSLLLKADETIGADLSLYDINPVVKGVAVDLSHIPTKGDVKGYGKEELKEAVIDSDIIVITAGVPRKPGMTRDDLFKINAGIITTLVTEIAHSAPEACLGIVTNPVNAIVPIAAKILEKEGVKNQLFGVTMLDVIRAKTFLSEIMGKDPQNIQVDVIGGHSGKTILPLLSQVEGLSISPEENQALIHRIQNAGTEVIEAKAGGGSATLSMGRAGYDFVKTLIKGLSGEKSRMCAYIQSENEKTKFFAKPVLIGEKGIESELLYSELDDKEKQMLEEIIPILEEDIKKGENFTMVS